MDVKKIKSWLCVTCKKSSITESIIEHTLEGDVPDQSNCDFSTYTDYQVSGGKLLANKPEQYSWRREFLINTVKIPIHMGGVCNICLGNPVVSALMEGDHIKFDKQGFKR